MTPSTFVELVLAGEAEPDQIDDYVAAWHEGEGGDSLPEFLGFTDDEYALWVEQPRTLTAIVTARRLGLDLAAAVSDSDAVGREAPSIDREQAERIREWFRERRMAS